MRAGGGRLLRFLLLPAVLALAWSAAGTVQASAAESRAGGSDAAVAVETGRIRVEGVSIRWSQWVSVGETGFHPDQTLVPGGPGRRTPPEQPSLETDPAGVRRTPAGITNHRPAGREMLPEGPEGKAREE